MATRLSKKYSILANPHGEHIEDVIFFGEDEEDILEQLESYLTHSKQNCYAEEIEEES